MTNLEQVVKDSHNYTEVLRKLNRTVSGRALYYIKKKIKRLNIDTSHFKYIKRIRKDSRDTLENVLIFDNNLSNRIKHQKLKKYLLVIGREYVCEECGIDTWRGSKITLEIDHKDGNWRNNLPKNLRFLCRNCHGLTPNFYQHEKRFFCECGQRRSRVSKKCKSCATKINGFKSRKVIRPTKEELEIMIQDRPITHIAKDFNVTDSAVRRWCKSYGIKPPERGYWQKIRAKK